MGEGEHRAVEAATNAISSPLLEDISVDGATGLIINVTGGPDLTAFEVNEATTLIMEAAHEDAEIIFGSVIDENMKNKVKITVIATGIGANAFAQALPSVAGTQAESLSSMTKPASMMAMPPAPPAVPERPLEVRAPSATPSAMAMPPTSPAASASGPAMPEPRAAVPPPAPARPMITQAADLDSIIPSASLDEVDAHIDAQATEAPVPAQEEELPRPAAATAAPAPSSAVKMEQVEMFEEKAEVRAPREEAAPKRDPRAESLARAQQIARSLGVTNLTDDEYDIPTFIRRQQQNPPLN
jgi:cell division protein FtsZ